MTLKYRNLASITVSFLALSMLFSSLAIAQSMAPGAGIPKHKPSNEQGADVAAAQDKMTKTLFMVKGLSPEAAAEAKRKAQDELAAAMRKEAADQAAAAITANQTCVNGRFTNVRWWLPINYAGAGDVQPDSNMNGVICFFGNTGPAAFINQVQFLYGFGSSANSISVDVTSLQFGAGFQVSLGSTITGSSPKSSNNATTPNSQAATDQAIQQIENGGDFYLKTIYPLAYFAKGKEGSASDLSLLVAAAPRLGFTVPGMSSQTTLTESSEYNWNVPIEVYGQYTALGNSGLLYFDARSGYQYVQPAFASAAGLGSKNNFLLTQVAAGIQYNGLIRIGFQKFYGPAQLFNVNQSEFNKWHLVLQFAPNQMMNSKKNSGSL